MCPAPFWGLQAQTNVHNGKQATFLPWCFHPRKCGLLGLEEGNGEAALPKLPFASLLWILSELFHAAGKKD